MQIKKELQEEKHGNMKAMTQEKRRKQVTFNSQVWAEVGEKEKEKEREGIYAQYQGHHFKGSSNEIITKGHLQMFSLKTRGN